MVGKNIANFFQVGFKKWKVHYNGQKQCCYGSGSANHEVADCPVNGKGVGVVYSWVDSDQKPNSDQKQICPKGNQCSKPSGIGAARYHKL